MTVCLPVCLSYPFPRHTRGPEINVSVSACLRLCLCLSLSVSISLCLSLTVVASLSICACLCLSVSVCVCLSVYLCLSLCLFMPCWHYGCRRTLLAIWGLYFAIFGHTGDMLGLSALILDQIGTSWVHLGLSRAILGLSWGHLAPFEDDLEATLGPCCDHIGLSWGYLNPSWIIMGLSGTFTHINCSMYRTWKS
jgi:hypothetical protein